MFFPFLCGVDVWVLIILFSYIGCMLGVVPPFITYNIYEIELFCRFFGACLPSFFVLLLVCGCTSGLTGIIFVGPTHVTKELGLSLGGVLSVRVIADWPTGLAFVTSCCRG